MSFSISYADGTRNFVDPQDTVRSYSYSGFENEASLLLFNAQEGNPYIGTVEADDLEQFHIHIDDADTEVILLGFKIGRIPNNSKLFVRVTAPDGTSSDYSRVLSYGAGCINTYKEVYEGPSNTVTTGGYTPLVFYPKANLPGDYILEFNNTENTDRVGNTPNGFNRAVILQIFDFSVGRECSTQGQKTHDLIPGRFYSHQFPMINHYYGAGYNAEGVDFSYYAYHDIDKVVTRLNWNRVVGGAWIILFNETGPNDTGDLYSDRKSDLTDDSELATPKFPIFLAPPDVSIFEISDIEPIFEFYDFKVDCETSLPTFYFSINRSGRLEILLEFDDVDNEYTPGTSDRIIIIENVTQKKSQVSWDGLDAFGNDRLGGTVDFSMKALFSIGSINNPMYDVERVLEGLSVDLIAPSPSVSGWNANPKIYWDDTNINTMVSNTPPGYNYSGCSEGCHLYGTDGSSIPGDKAWVNSWWTANESVTIEHITQYPDVLDSIDINVWSPELTDCDIVETEIYIGGLIRYETYTVSYKLDGIEISPQVYESDDNGIITILNSPIGRYSDFSLSGGYCVINQNTLDLDISCLTALDDTLSCQSFLAEPQLISIPDTSFLSSSDPEEIFAMILPSFPSSLDMMVIDDVQYTASSFTEGVEIRCDDYGFISDSIFVLPKENITLVDLPFILKNEDGITSNTASVIIPISNIEVEANILPSLCDGATGSIDISVSGGVAPYTFLWTSISSSNEDLTNLNVGVYDLLVTDAYGCVESFSFETPSMPISGDCNISGVDFALDDGTNTVVLGNNNLLVSDGGGSHTWENLYGLVEDDSDYAYMSLNDATSNDLLISGFDFSAIPSNAIVQGVVLKIDKYNGVRFTTSVEDNKVQLRLGNTTSPNYAQANLGWSSNSASTSKYGAANDLWGLDISYDDLQDIEVIIKVQGEGGSLWGYSISSRPRIDYVELSVTYSIAAQDYEDANVYSFAVDTFVNADYYLWYSTSGATVVQGQGSDTATFDLNNLGPGEYEICVVPSNTCDTVAPCCTTIVVDDVEGELSISGNVFIDEDGSEGSNFVDGIGISMLDSLDIYAYLCTKSDSIIVEKQGVLDNGTFCFREVEAAIAYKVVISVDSYDVGDIALATLPYDWVFVGEKDNNFENSLPGNDAIVSSITDGVTNGELWLESVLEVTSASNLNFGVCKAPYGSNQIFCPQDSVGACNGILPAKEGAEYSSSPMWSLVNYGDDYPGVQSSVGCLTTIVVSYWAEWKILGLLGTYTDTCYYTFSYTDDDEGPIFDVPSDTVIYRDDTCGYALSPDSTGQPLNIIDNCTNYFDTLYTDVITGLTTCVDTGLVERTWVITDSCGNSTSLIQHITIAPPKVDYGDVPLSYELEDPASHCISPSSLYLGSIAPDGDNGPYGSTGLGDDDDGVDDEDAITFFIPYTTARTSYVTYVPFHNSTEHEVTVSAWIDLDKNGVFDAYEGVSSTALVGQTSVRLEWTSLPVLLEGFETYIRIRLASDPNEANSPTGVASDGEVEDYPFTVHYAGECPNKAFIVQGENSLWYDVDLASDTIYPGDVNDENSGKVNGVGFNVIDGLIYGWENSVKDGSIIVTSINSLVSPTKYLTQIVGPIAGLPVGAKFITGDVGDGKLYLAEGNMSMIYVVNVDPDSPGCLSEVSSFGVSNRPNSIYVTDMVYLPSDGNLHFINNRNGDLCKIDISTQELSIVQEASVYPRTYGAQFLDVNGFLYASDNDSGFVYRVSLLGNPDYLGRKWGTAPTDSKNDGARCPFASVPIDFGDAPASYITILSLNQQGARHAVPLYDPTTHTAPLMLGQKIDIEIDGQPDVLAVSDDKVTSDGISIDDEDALDSVPVLSMVNTSYSLSVRLLNNTSGQAYLSGFIDFDANGVFDTDERAHITIPHSASEQQVVLTWTGLGEMIDVVADTSYIRLRLSSISNDVINGDGLAYDGEVEDYMIVIEDKPENLILTDYVNFISENSATLHGAVSVGNNIVEYGFCYSHDTNTPTELSGTLLIDSILLVPDYINNFRFDTEIENLTNRKNCYFRAYMKDVSGDYYYGSVMRFITERRDFSLYLDGDAGLLVDSTSTQKLLKQGSNGAFSIDFWIKNDGSGADFASVVSMLDNDYLNTPELFKVVCQSSLLGGRLIFYDEHIPTLVSNARVDDAAWHHVALSYNGLYLDLFVDGSLDNTVNVAIDFSQVCNVSIGLKTSVSSSAYKGNIDALRFWSQSLTEDLVYSLAYDNIISDDVGNVKLVGSQTVLSSLDWSRLNGSFGFNVRSMLEGVVASSPSYFTSQEEWFDYPFFHEDSRLNTYNYPQSGVPYSFNVIAVGNARISADLPRVNWRVSPDNEHWLFSDNWSAFAYPGQGATLVEYPDLLDADVVDDASHCKYTIIGTSDIIPVISTTPPEVDVLVECKSAEKAYYINSSSTSELYIMSAIVDSLFEESIQGSVIPFLLTEEGSVEVGN